jgi:hypothetical protein
VDIHIYTWIHPRLLQTEYRPINQRLIVVPFAIRRPWNGTRTSPSIDTNEIIGSSDFDLRGFFYHKTVATSSTKSVCAVSSSKIILLLWLRNSYCLPCHLPVLYSQTGPEIAWHDKQKFLHNQSSNSPEFFLKGILPK